MCTHMHTYMSTLQPRSWHSDSSSLGGGIMDSFIFFLIILCISPAFYHEYMGALITKENVISLPKPRLVSDEGAGVRRDFIRMYKSLK